MSSSRQGVWSQEDDDLLAHWQAHYGNRWSEVAKHISGKTGQQCAQRWRHRVNPNIRRAKWTEEEDSLLASLYQQHGGAWAVIARLIPGRTDQQCMGRWRRHLDPSVRRESWSPREDDILHRLADQYDRSWCLVARGLKGRTPQQCRTRWHYLASNPAAAAASKAAFEADPSSTTFQPARRTRIRPKNKKKRKATVRSHDHGNDDDDDGAAAGADLEEEFQDDMDYREEGGWDEPYMFEEGEDLAGDTRHPLRLVAAAAAAAAATSALNAVDETAPSTSPPKTVPAASQPATRSCKSALTRETRAVGGRSRSRSGVGDETHHRASKRRRTCSRSVYGNVNASEEEEISDMEEEEGVDALHIRRTQARRHLGGQVEEHKGAAAASPLVAVPTGLLIDNDDEDGGPRYWGGWAAPPPAMSHEKKKAQQSRAGGMGGRFPRNVGRNDIEDRRKTTETLEDVRRHAANALIFSDDDDDDEGELIEHAAPLEHDVRTRAGGGATGRTSRRSTIIAHIAGEEHGDESDDDEEYYPSQRAKRRAMAVATSRGQGTWIDGAPPASVPFATTELLHHEHSARFLKLNPTVNGVEGNAGPDVSRVSKRMAPLQSPILPQQQQQIQQPTSAVAAAHGSGGRPAARQGSPADRNTKNRNLALDNGGLLTPHRQKPALFLGGQLHAVADDPGQQQQQRHKSRDGEDGDVVCKDDGAEAATALISRYLHQRHLAHASPSPSPGLFNSADGMNDATASDALFFQGTQGVEITPPRLVQRRRARSYSLGVRSASHDDHAVAPPGPRVKLASPQENRYLQLLQSPPFAQHHGNVANEDTMMGEEYFMRGHYAAPSPQLNGLITPEWARAAAAATAAADSSREEARRASMDAVVRRLDVDAAVLGSAPSQGPPPPHMPAGGSVCPPHSQQRLPSHGHHVQHPIAASPTATTATTTTTTTTTATMHVLPGTLKTTHDPALTPPKRTNNHHNATSVDPPLSSDRSISISAGGIPPTTTAAAAALASASVSVQIPAATPQSCTATTVEQGDAGHSKYPLHTLPPPINLTPPSTGHLSGAHPLMTPHAATQQLFSNNVQPTPAQRYFGGAVGGENHALADRGTATRVLFPGQGPSTRSHSHSHSQQHEGGAVLDGRSSPPSVLGSLPMTTPSLTKAIFAAPESMPSQQRPPQEQRCQQQGGATLASSMAALPAAGPLQVAVRPYLASHRFPGNGEGSGDGDGASFAAAAAAAPQTHVTPKSMPSPGTARDQRRQPVGHTPSGSIATSVVYGEIGSDVVMKKGMAGGQTGLHPYLMQHAATSPGERGSLQPEPSTQWQLRWYTRQGQTPGVPAVSRGGQHYARVPSQLVGHVGMGYDACAATPPSTAACGAPVLQQTVVPPSGTLRQETSRPSSNAAGATPSDEGPMRMSGKAANAPAAFVEAQKKASGAAVKEQRPLTASQVRSKLRSLLGSA